jgi:hypothetical protein
MQLEGYLSILLNNLQKKHPPLHLLGQRIAFFSAIKTCNYIKQKNLESPLKILSNDGI